MTIIEARTESHHSATLTLVGRSHHIRQNSALNTESVVMWHCGLWHWWCRWSWVESLNFAPNPSPSVPETQWAGAYHSASSGSYNYKPQPVRHHQQQLQLHIWPQSAIYLTVTLPLSWSGSQLKLIRRNAEAREITQQTEYIFYFESKSVYLTSHLTQGYSSHKFDL